MLKDFIRNKRVILRRDDERRNGNGTERIFSCTFVVIVVGVAVAPVRSCVDVVEFPHGSYRWKLREIPFPGIELIFAF